MCLNKAEKVKKQLQNNIQLKQKLKSISFMNEIVFRNEIIYTTVKSLRELFEEILY